jgi:hypothetical protein
MADPSFGPAGGWARRRVSTLGFVAAVAVLASSCSPSGYRYVKAVHPKLSYELQVGPEASGQKVPVAVKAASVYFKLPKEWALYNTDDLVRYQATDQTPEELLTIRQAVWGTGFDGDPKSSIDHIGAGRWPHPAGKAQVAVLADEERDQVSLAALRNIIAPIDQDLADAKTQNRSPIYDIISQGDVEQGTLHGTRMRFNIRQDDGSIYTRDETVLMDQKARFLYFFVIGCETTCFRENVSTINRVLKSWTLKEKT